MEGSAEQHIGASGSVHGQAEIEKHRSVILSLRKSGSELVGGDPRLFLRWRSIGEEEIIDRPAG